MSSSHMVYTSRLSATSEQVRDARARAWRFVFDCYAKKKAEIGEEKADVSTADENAKKEITSDECGATSAIPR